MSVHGGENMCWGQGAVHMVASQEAERMGQSQSWVSLSKAHPQGLISSSQASPPEDSTASEQHGKLGQNFQNKNLKSEVEAQAVALLPSMYEAPGQRSPGTSPVVHACSPDTRKKRQKDQDFKVICSYIVS